MDVCALRVRGKGSIYYVAEFVVASIHLLVFVYRWWLVGRGSEEGRRRVAGESEDPSAKCSCSQGEEEEEGQ